MNSYDIIIRPIITERSMADVASKKYVFEVAKDAGKVEIKNAVETAFGVKVKDVNTLNVFTSFTFTPNAVSTAFLISILPASFATSKTYFLFATSAMERSVMIGRIMISYALAITRTPPQ